jgi:hypothetical protein
MGSVALARVVGPLGVEEGEGDGFFDRLATANQKYEETGDCRGETHTKFEAALRF